MDLHGQGTPFRLADQLDEFLGAGLQFVRELEVARGVGGERPVDRRDAAVRGGALPERLRHARTEIPFRARLGRAGAEEDLWNRTVRVRILGIVEDHKNQDIAFEVRLL